MKTTAATAMETFFSLPPVDLVLKSRAFATTVSQNGLFPNRTWKSWFNTEQNFRNVQGSDKTGVEFRNEFWNYVSGKARRVGGWSASLPGYKLGRFTDWSKTDEGSGAGLYDPETEAGTWVSLWKFANDQAKTGKRYWEVLPTQGKEALTVLTVNPWLRR